MAYFIPTLGPLYPLPKYDTLLLSPKNKFLFSNYKLGTTNGCSGIHSIKFFYFKIDTIMHMKFGVSQQCNLVFKKWANTCLFCLFSFISNTNFKEKTVDFRRIRTCIIRVAGERPWMKYCLLFCTISKWSSLFLLDRHQTASCAWCLSLVIDERFGEAPDESAPKTMYKASRVKCSPL